ncbi:T6SS immunity protein Tli4 family protein [Burkholderia sp. WSM2232]|uniref:T6SS immunity protein Tli4 family protein n=1 Tax=Burkholderia sp. WSM2232 TaxID=944436 RepID=UPI0012EB3998|nr:T6SS immunity protein Tli4 family protein [Burkholderia sp. WSM2232]
MRGRLVLRSLHIGLVACLCGLSLFVHNAVAANYHECVGRYELSLPGEVDVATTTSLVFDDAVIRNPDKHILYPIQFPDGQQTMYSSFGFNGKFQIVRGISDAWAKAFLQKSKDFVIASKREPTADQQFIEVSTGQPNSVALSGTRVSEFDRYMNGQMIVYTATSFEDSPEVTRKRMMNTLASLRAREPYEIPRQAGACLPGIFVASKAANDFSNIGVTFRLKEHPDVTIFLADRSAGDLSKMTSRQRNEFVWTSDAIGRVIHLHGPLRYRPTMMAGRSGAASFATVTRYDGATDYAYLVTVQGDPNATVDTPDLELLVQRTAKYAVKGVSPVSGEELERIAKAVAASVKRRPVQ